MYVTEVTFRYHIAAMFRGDSGQICQAQLWILCNRFCCGHHLMHRPPVAQRITSAAEDPHCH